MHSIVLKRSNYTKFGLYDFAKMVADLSISAGNKNVGYYHLFYVTLLEPRCLTTLKSHYDTLDR
jgi:hypothetical protein